MTTPAPRQAPPRPRTGPTILPPRPQGPPSGQQPYQGSPQGQQQPAGNSYNGQQNQSQDQNQDQQSSLGPQGIQLFGLLALAVVSIVVIVLYTWIMVTRVMTIWPQTAVILVASLMMVPQLWNYHTRMQHLIDHPTAERFLSLSARNVGYTLGLFAIWVLGYFTWLNITGAPLPPGLN